MRDASLSRETKDSSNWSSFLGVWGFLLGVTNNVWEHKICRIAKDKEKIKRYLDQVIYAKDEEGEIHVSDGDIICRWEIYFYRFSNEEGGTSTCDLEDLAISKMSFIIGLELKKLMKLLRKWKIENLLDLMISQLVTHHPRSYLSY